MAIAAGIVVVLAVGVVVVTRPHTRSSPVPASSAAVGPLSLADCQAALAKPAPGAAPDCGYPPGGVSGRDEPAADPNDRRYAGAALPTGLTTENTPCVTGAERPALDTVYPTFKAYFTAVPGLAHTQSTFQLRGIDGYSPQDFDVAGQEGAGAWAAKLDLHLTGTALQHGVSYRWRVRATPPSVAAGGWSLWCEFTIGAKTSDDLGLDQARKYPVVRPAAQWREILHVLGPVETYVDGGRSSHAPIADALKTAPASAPRIAVTMNGRAWSSVVNALAYHASTTHSGANWKLADAISAALDGPERVTMGFPRD